MENLSRTKKKTCSFRNIEVTIVEFGELPTEQTVYTKWAAIECQDKDDNICTNFDCEFVKKRVIDKSTKSES